MIILILISLGAVLGYIIAWRQWEFYWALAPAALGVLAYYERDIAFLIFIIIAIIIIL
ncbi:Uncharacterised protein [uncultured archaeon]|nr:Uncharacterised protein [uncultured archaeon]